MRLDLRDESKVDTRVVVEVKKGENAEILLNNLYKLTQMQTSFGVNLVALVGGGSGFEPQRSLVLFYHHRREVILRRTAYQLARAEKAHILLGLKALLKTLMMSSLLLER